MFFLIYGAIRQIVKQKCNLKHYLHASADAVYFRIPPTTYTWYSMHQPSLYTYRVIFLFVRITNRGHRTAVQQQTQQSLYKTIIIINNNNILLYSGAFATQCELAQRLYINKTHAGRYHIVRKSVYLYLLLLLF